jgi:SAM-dependent methyltransferase
MLRFFSKHRGLKRADGDPRLVPDENTLPDELFVEQCYRYFLDRQADPWGKTHFLQMLREGTPRLKVIKEIIGSKEFQREKRFSPYLGDKKTLSDELFIEQCYWYFLDRQADPGGKTKFLGMLREGFSRLKIIKEIIDSEEFQGKKEFSRHLADEDTRTDELFVEQCFQYLLERQADPASKAKFLQMLRAGTPRLRVIKEIIFDDEFQTNYIASRNSALQLADLKKLRPDQYQTVQKLGTEEKCLTLKIESGDDFDWLERMIATYGYYDKLGVWEAEANEDKEVTAGMAELLSRGSCLEIGCFTGSVIGLLQERGIEAEGVEISHLALVLADRRIRNRIHFGDILHLDFGKNYDLILAMDVFEHLNPNKLGSYLTRCHQLLNPGGRILVNIPAYGEDKVFGQVHPYLFDEWLEEDRRNAIFTRLQVDRDGWPISGHLIWANTSWWERQFVENGFAREEGLEKELHSRFDPFFLQQAPARRSLYVFGKKLDGRMV